MRRFLRTVCFLMAAVMLFSTTAFAAESRSSNFFAKSSTYIDRSSSSKLDIWFDVTAVGTMQVLGVRSIELQKSTDKTNWSYVKTYEMADFPQMTCSNTVAHADCVTYYGNSSYYYRAYVEFYAKNSSGTGVYGKYTATV